MLEWMILPLKRYADFKGRSRRKEFWSWILFNVIVLIVLMAIVFGTGFSTAAILADPGNPLAVYGSLFSGTGVLLLIWGLATFIPNIAVTVRRLHDRDMSGWWYLGFFIAGFIPFVNMISGIALIVLMFLDGTRGPNRFGPDPKDPTSAAVFA
ncbi:DUF805 domain-containing protein [Novosphingobium sp. PS1R-30]|uniref:DUF805 domain-containing protein n=1 Tax=Novosphingobium anseongense TaxID=3133436 RepID=A0ABU8RYS6_9SPHN|nr:MAG: DUF805 domain-containing protein [Novosphingobium sp.]